MGNEFTINVSEGNRRASKASTSNNDIRIELAQGLGREQKRRHVRVLSIRTISNCVLPDVLRRVNELNVKHFNFQLSNVKIKRQTSRWGSYSKRTNSIYLNFRLLFAPPEVLDYVIVHELAHIKVLNHSAAFWDLVKTAVPDFKERRKWLRNNRERVGIGLNEGTDQSGMF